MSFLNGNNSDFVSARITKRGRSSIAKGDFKISFFQVGDSEFDYSTPFNVLDGVSNNPYQKVFSPFDNEPGVKYPYKLDNTETSTTYGVPIQNSISEPIRNVMGPSGFVTRYTPFNGDECLGTVIKCYTETIDIPTTFIGTNTVDVSDGTLFQDTDYVTLTLGEFVCSDPTLSGISNSFVYKITDIQTNTLYLDRNLPILTGLTGNGQIICNSCQNEDPDVCLPQSNPTEQLDPWTLNIVWGDNPIGYTGLTQNNLTGYTSNKFISTKQFLGYTTSSGQTINSGTTYTNSFNETIYVTPEEQRCIAVIHFSELGTVTDPERFYKFDDYISTNNVENDAIFENDEDLNVTDLEYFEVYIPLIYYHRNTGTTIGATFHMDDTDYTISTPTGITDGRMSLIFRYLLDENDNRVGKIFYNNKVIVFDDQELVALLDFRTNRRYTLDSPKAFIVPSDLTPANSLISGSSEQTFWITYTFTNDDLGLNGLPCNYYTKVTTQQNQDECAVSIASNIGVKFGSESFQHMKTTLSDIKNGFVGTNFKILIQETQPNEYPSPEYWKEIDFTTEAGGNGINFLDPNDIREITFLIDKNDFDSASFYVLDTYMGNGYFDGTVKFGDEQPFPGSVSVVRATDLQVMNFQINLPSSQFTETQNPTYTIGKDKKITDVTLLNNNKEVLVVGKMSKPLTRVGSQVISVKLDF